MSEVQKIKELTPQFQFVVLININIIEQLITEIICVDVTKDAKDIVKRIAFMDYFEKIAFQSKIDLLKIILKVNHSDISARYSDFFTELGDVKKWRDYIAHSPIAFERDSNEQNARLILSHRIIKKQRRLSERQMLAIMKKAEKCTSDVRSIWTLIGKSKGLRF